MIKSELQESGMYDSCFFFGAVQNRRKISEQTRAVTVVVTIEGSVVGRWLLRSRLVVD